MIPDKKVSHRVVLIYKAIKWGSLGLSLAVAVAVITIALLLDAKYTDNTTTNRIHVPALSLVAAEALIVLTYFFVSILNYHYHWIYSKFVEEADSDLTSLHTRSMLSIITARVPNNTESQSVKNLKLKLRSSQISRDIVFGGVLVILDLVSIGASIGVFETTYRQIQGSRGVQVVIETYGSILFAFVALVVLLRVLRSFSLALHFGHILVSARQLYHDKAAERACAQDGDESHLRRILYPDCGGSNVDNYDFNKIYSENLGDKCSRLDTLVNNRDAMASTASIRPVEYAGSGDNSVSVSNTSHNIKIHRVSIRSPTSDYRLTLHSANMTPPLSSNSITQFYDDDVPHGSLASIPIHFDDSGAPKRYSIRSKSAMGSRIQKTQLSPIHEPSKSVSETPVFKRTLSDTMALKGPVLLANWNNRDPSAIPQHDNNDSKDVSITELKPMSLAKKFEENASFASASNNESYLATKASKGLKIVTNASNSAKADQALSQNQLFDNDMEEIPSIPTNSLWPFSKSATNSPRSPDFNGFSPSIFNRSTFGDDDDRRPAESTENFDFIPMDQRETGNELPKANYSTKLTLPAKKLVLEHAGDEQFTFEEAKRDRQSCDADGMNQGFKFPYSDLDSEKSRSRPRSFGKLRSRSYSPVKKTVSEKHKGLSDIPLLNYSKAEINTLINERGEKRKNLLKSNSLEFSPRLIRARSNSRSGSRSRSISPIKRLSGQVHERKRSTVIFADDELSSELKPEAFMFGTEDKENIETNQQDPQSSRGDHRMSLAKRKTKNFSINSFKSAINHFHTVSTSSSYFDVANDESEIPTSEWKWDTAVPDQKISTPDEYIQEIIEQTDCNFDYITAPKIAVLKEAQEESMTTTNNSMLSRTQAQHNNTSNTHEMNDEGDSFYFSERSSDKVPSGYIGEYDKEKWSTTKNFEQLAS